MLEPQFYNLLYKAFLMTRQELKMAGSRVHKLGSIFTRTTGLIERRAIAEKPLWYDVYKEHPPISEPTFEKKIEDIPVRSILYEEDEIRAKIHKNLHIGPFNLSYDNKKSESKKLRDECHQLMLNKGMSMDEAVEHMKQESKKKDT